MAPRKTRSTASKSSRRKTSGLALEGPVPYLVFGTLFGYFLSKSRATDYDSIVAMFRCQEFQLYGVIIVAVATVSLGLFLLNRGGNKTFSGTKMDLEPLKWDPNRLPGAFLFGAGWALAGTCPGTSLAQIGEGKLIAFATVLGIGAGVWAYKKFRPGMAAKNDVVC
jgi:uncharacterized membrane protein YedE/YeeE